MGKLSWLGHIAFVLALLPVAANAADPYSWLMSQKQISTRKMMNNISRNDTAPGAVVAALSRENPDYYYHWVRDAGLTMDAVLTSYLAAGSLEQKNHFKEALFQFVDFSRRNQTVPTLSDLGEPKFFVDGRAYDLPWGRPQNDGPALRAIALTRFALVLLSEGSESYVRTRLYDSRIPTYSVIKTDLEYVSHHWRESSFDVWEEIRGDHFYTRMVQRRALLDGARLARILGDGGAAGWYESQARQIQTDMERFWRQDKGLIVPTLNRVEGLDYKHSDMDSAVILAVLHGYTGDGFYAPSNDRVLSTLQKLTDTFASLYPINRQQGSAGIAIGRYPEDRFAGANFNGGNPWFLLTLGFAEAYYRAAYEVWKAQKVRMTPVKVQFVNRLLHRKGVQQLAFQSGETLTIKDPRFTTVVKALKEQGDDFINRVKYHANPDGSMSEQIDRRNGYQTSARDLTWSYVAMVTAASYRQSMR